MVRNTDSAVCFTPWFPRSDRSDDCLSAWWGLLSCRQKENKKIPNQILKCWCWNDAWDQLIKKNKKRMRVSHSVHRDADVYRWQVSPAEEDCNNIYCRVNLCVGFSAIWSLCQSSSFSVMKGKKQTDTLDLLNKPSAPARMFKVF